MALNTQCMSLLLSLLSLSLSLTFSAHSKLNVVTIRKTIILEAFASFFSLKEKKTLKMLRALIYSNQTHSLYYKYGTNFYHIFENNSAE